MPDLKTLYADFENGMYLATAKETIVKGYKLAGLFPKKELDTKQVTIIDREPIDKFKDQTGKSKKIAKGASARKIRGKLVTPEGFKLVHNEIEYIIENEDMEHPTFDLVSEIQAMSYVLADDIDKSVYDTVKENAKVVQDNKIKAKWGEDATDIKAILADLIRFRGSIRPKPFNINAIAMGSEANIELTSKSAQSTTAYTLPQNGFEIEDSLQMANSQNFWGGIKMDDGELFGFDLQNPALDVLHKKYKNPKITSVPTIPGMESIVPQISMLMYDDSEKSTEPQTTIKVATTSGAYPRAKGEKMIRYPDIIS